MPNRRNEFTPGTNRRLPPRLREVVDAHRVYIEPTAGEEKTEITQQHARDTAAALQSAVAGRRVTQAAADAANVWLNSRAARTAAHEAALRAGTYMLHMMTDDDFNNAIMEAITGGTTFTLDGLDENQSLNMVVAEMQRREEQRPPLNPRFREEAEASIWRTVHHIPRYHPFRDIAILIDARRRQREEELHTGRDQALRALVELQRAALTCSHRGTPSKRWCTT